MGGMPLSKPYGEVIVLTNVLAIISLMIVMIMIIDDDYNGDHDDNKNDCDDYYPNGATLVRTCVLISSWSC